MPQQITIKLPPFKRGMHPITGWIQERLPALPETGLLHIFIKHTSAALSLSENADPDVSRDLTKALDKLAPENESWYTHTLEGSDDMPAHIKSVLLGSSLSIPISNGRISLGTWQGIFLCEFRNHAGPRTLVITVLP